MSREIRIPAEAAAALARGARIEAIKLVREANHGVDLRGAMEATDAYASGKHLPVADAPPLAKISSVDGLPGEAIAALSRGQLIEAIKIVRAATGLGLKEAKDMVERHSVGPAPVRDAAMRAKFEAIAGKQGVKLPEEAFAAMERGDLRQAMKLVRQAKETGLKQLPTGAYAAGTARGASTVSRESNRYGWLWALVALAAVAAGYFWFAAQT